jgi:uncharacterized membrane protein
MPSPPPATPKRPEHKGFDRIVATFLAGLFFLLPFVLTLMILDWLVRQIAGIFGPGTLIGSALSSGGTLLFGETGFATWLLLALVVLAIWAIGYVFQSRARRSIEQRVDAFVDRIPILGGVYRPVAQFVRMIGMKDEGDLAGMRVVACRFGQGADVLGLLTSPDVLMVGSEERMLVYLPTAPLPMTGGLVLVPRASVVPVDGVAVEDLLKLYVSLGTVAPRAIRRPSGGT